MPRSMPPIQKLKGQGRPSGRSFYLEKLMHYRPNPMPSGSRAPGDSGRLEANSPAIPRPGLVFLESRDALIPWGQQLAAAAAEFIRERRHRNRRWRR
jgi:hypothetical protein